MPNKIRTLCRKNNRFVTDKIYMKNGMVASVPVLMPLSEELTKDICFNV